MTAAHGQSDGYTPDQTYADVLTTLMSSYYGKNIDATQMTYNGIRGMVGATHDRYTTFMDPKAYKDMEEENLGQFVGIGALLGTNKAQQVYVVRPLPGGPAIKAKVMAGDIIPEGQRQVRFEAQGLRGRQADPRAGRGRASRCRCSARGAPKPVLIAITRATVHQEVVQHA